MSFFVRVLGRALKNQIWQLSLVLSTSGGTEIICLANLGLRVKTVGNYQLGRGAGVAAIRYLGRLLAKSCS